MNMQYALTRVTPRIRRVNARSENAYIDNNVFHSAGVTRATRVTRRTAR